MKEIILDSERQKIRRGIEEKFLRDNEKEFHDLIVEHVREALRRDESVVDEIRRLIKG